MRRIAVFFAAACLLVCLQEAGADAPPAPTAGVAIAIDSRPDAQGKVSVTTENPTSTAQQLEMELRVVDFFQKPVLSMRKRLAAAPGQQTIEMGSFPARDAKRFRADLRWRFGSGAWQETHPYADVDYVASGPRRSQRIDLGPWQRLVPAEAPPGAPAYPPQGTWDATTFPLKPAWSKDSHWTWFRQEIAPQPWLAGKAVELRIAQADHNCHVYLNGQKAGEHMISTTPFALDVTKQWRPGQANVLDLAVGDMVTTYADVSKGMALNMITPRFGHGGEPGLWEAISLVAHSPVYVEDVFVIPSVKRRELKVRTWLRNSGDEAARVQLAHVIEDAGRRALSVPSQAVSLRPGEARMVETTRVWRSPKLWWPHSPHLYRLRTQLTAGATPVDEVSTRFGFREVSIRDRNLLLNGRVFRPFGVSSAGEGPGQRQPRRETIEWWRHHTQADSPWLMRLHVQVRAEWYAEVADEMGVCLEPETEFCSVVFYDFQDPRFWLNTIRHAEELVTRDRNSPSVIYWSAGNEVILAAGACKTPIADIISNCKREIAAMKEADPTRPVIFEGGMDETAEIIDQHYPRDWYKHMDFPNAAFWLKPGVMTESDWGQTPVFIWKGDRPLTMGEEGQLFTTQPPHDMAAFMGDSAYLETPRYAGSARFRALDDTVGAAYLEGHRRSGVVRTAPDLGASGGPKMHAARKLVRSFVSPHDGCFLSGAMVQREITLFHDALVPGKLRIAWQVRARGSRSAVAAGAEFSAMGPGDVRHLRISWRAPAVAEPTKLVLETRLTAKQGEVFREEHEYTVYPVQPVRVPAGASIGLYDPKGATDTALSRLGVTGLKRIDALSPASLSGLSALILGEDLPAEPEGAKEALAALTQSGGKVILLRQSGQTGLKWAPVKGLSRTAGMQHTYCFVRDYEHPLVAGLDDSLLRLWGTDHVVARDALAKMTGRNAVPIIDAGGPKAGLAYAPLTEIALPRGSWVLCQLNVVQKADIHPGARRLLQNLLDYAAGPPHRTVAPVGVFVAEGSTVRRLLGELGVVTRDVAGEGLGPVRAVVVDETGIEGRAEQIRRFAEQGASVLVKGLSPETLGRFRGLFPVPVELAADDRTRRPVQETHDPLTSGISNEELYWERRSQQFALQPEHLTGSPVYSYLIRPGASAKALYRTEVRDFWDKPVESRGAGLVRIPVGQGWLVVDQTRWEAAYEPPLPEVYGQNKTFDPGLRRYVSLLLTNLGAQQN